MSKLSDVWHFADYSARDSWDKLKQDPERLVIGAIDPFSSWAWGSILGKNYTPVLNAFGSPQGGGFLGTDRNGGVYKSAEQNGVATGSAKKFFGTGDAIAGLFGGSAATQGISAGLSGGSAAADAGTTAADSSGLLADGATPLADTGGGILADSPDLVAGASSDAPLMSTSEAANLAPTIDSTAAPTLDIAKSGSNLGAYAKAGQALMNQQPQQQQPMMQTRPVDVQAQQRARLNLLQETQLQQLRMKPNKTMQDYQQLAQMNHNQGLLGQ